MGFEMDILDLPLQELMHFINNLLVDLFMPMYLIFFTRTTMLRTTDISSNIASTTDVENSPIKVASEILPVQLGVTLSLVLLQVVPVIMVGWSCR